MALGRVLLALHDADTGDLGPVLAAAHDVSNGGLVQALADMSVRAGVGASVDLTDLCDEAGIDSFTALFSESQARAVLAVPEGYLDLVLRAAEAEGVPAVRIGTTGGELLVIEADGDIADALVFDVAELAAASDGVLRGLFDQ